MSKSSTASSRSRTGTFPSPGTPNYTRHSAAAVNTAVYPSGWASERVPLSTSSSNRRSGVLLPFNDGHKLPSKWEDAEKWILSPVSSDGADRFSLPPPHHRRPKSKSGPLGHPTGVPGAFLSASPPVHAGAAFGPLSSPFSTGVLMADQKHNFVLNCGMTGNEEPAILRSSSMNISPEMLTGPEDAMVTAQAAPVVSSPAVKKDASTQMSPNGSACSSPRGRLSLSYLSSHRSCAAADADTQVAKVEIRDVPVDDQVTVTRWSKRHGSRISDKRSSSSMECLTRAPSFDERGRSICISKCKQEEAKITAWENLQKAKAEAAIRKLEMKLEKKRSSSMDKILNKLRSAQRRAQDMRRAVSANRDQCGTATMTTNKASQFSSCFRCLAC